MKFWNSTVKKLKPYVYGEQPAPAKGVIKLNTNENPYPPHKELRKLLSTLDINRLKYYPPPVCERLAGLIAKRYSVQSKFIFIGNGSDEILSYLFRAFLNKEDTVLFTKYTYSLYTTLADIHGIAYKTLPMKNDFMIDLSLVRKYKAKLFFLTNPNAPTGMALPAQDIEKAIRESPGTLFVIDEAYADFSNENCIFLTKKYDNVIVLRTLSKSFSLCGIRLGYSIAKPYLTQALYKIKDSYNINLVTQLIAEHAFKKYPYYLKNCRKIIKTRENTAFKLKSLGFTVLPSKANFIFCTHSTINIKRLFLYLKKLKIYVRHFNNPVLDRYLRISIGTEREMNELFKNIKTYYSH
ncbi:histidinol-phosphate transaminase [Spirochaetota bacterium]